MQVDKCMKSGILFLLTLTCIGCMNTDVTYEYADGSGNVYHIVPSGLRYDPVTPERSSSGVYSGGEPKAIGWSLTEFNTVSDLLENAIGDTSQHQHDRAMMTGLVTRVSKSDTVRVVLQSRSRHIAAIEQTLKDILSRP